MPHCSNLHNLFKDIRSTASSTFSEQKHFFLSKALGLEISILFCFEGYSDDLLKFLDGNYPFHNPIAVQLVNSTGSSKPKHLEED